MPLLPARGEKATPEACFQHDMRGGSLLKRWRMPLPLTLALSP